MDDNKLYWPDIYIQPTLPQAISDELSFLEMLNQLQARINILRDLLEDFDSRANAYTDEQIKLLKYELESQIRNLQNQVNEINRTLDTAFADWDIKLKQAFDRVLYVLQNSQNLQNIEFKTAMREMYEEIVNMLVYGFLVVDPTTGKTNTVQIALDNLYNAILQGFGVSVGEYESLNLSVDEYERLFVSVYDYTYKNKDELFVYFFSPYFNPFTGRREPLQSIINTLAAFHMDNITVQAYNALDLSVQDYDDKNITVENYATFVG